MEDKLVKKQEEEKHKLILKINKLKNKLNG
jgi:hypothetical protein